MQGSTDNKQRFSAAANLKAVYKTKLYQQIASQIRDLIQEGKLKHGDQLPPERELAEIFRVSRHSVREAIRTLEEKSILKSRVGSGTYVILEDESSVVDFFARAIQREKGKLAEIFEFRRMIEPQIARRAAQNAVPEQIEKLEEIVRLQRKTSSDMGKSIELDQAFHLTLALATGNEILLRIVERINDILAESRAKVVQSPARRQRSIDGHNKILEAVHRRDPELAAKTMRSHLHEIEAVTLNNVNRTTSSAQRGKR